MNKTYEDLSLIVMNEEIIRTTGAWMEGRMV